MERTATAPESYDGLRHLIHEVYSELSPHLQRLAKQALDDPNAFALETVATLAERYAVQPSTLVRFAKQFGYSGFSQMQQVFKLRLIEGAPVSRGQVYEEHERLEGIVGDDPLTILHEFCNASKRCIDQLAESVDRRGLTRALELMREADQIYVIGQRRAFPIAAYLAYGLMRLEMRCHHLDFVGGMVPQQVATLGDGDLLVAVSFAEYAPSVVEVVRDAHIRGIPTLTITDVPSSPLAKHGTVCFTVDDAEVHRFRPVSGPMTLAQTLIMALSYLRDARPAPR